MTAGVGSIVVLYRLLFRDPEEIPPLNDTKTFEDKDDLPNVVKTSETVTCLPFRIGVLTFLVAITTKIIMAKIGKHKTKILL